MASLSTCYLELVVWDGNLVKSTKRHLMQLRMKLDNLKEAMSKN